MNLVHIKFLDNSEQEGEKTYLFYSEINFIEGNLYDIVVDNVNVYSCAARVIKVKKVKTLFGNYHKITHADLLSTPKKITGNIKHININKEKRTVAVVWQTGGVTTVKCHPDDTFDAEKGIAMCFMKKAFNNKGCYNDLIKEYLGDDYE